MRRRQPHGVCLSEADRAALRALVRDGRVEQRIARRARVLLAMADAGTVVEQLAAHVEMDRSSIWHLCRRFEQRGLEALADAPRTGRPRRLSPPWLACASSSWPAASRRVSASR
jgi:transposase